MRNELYTEQPFSSHTTWNRIDYRPLEGFVYAVTPFNFTAIAGNLPAAPAIMGNTVVWKPASSAMLSAYYVLRLLEKAGLPPGVINFVPGDAAQISQIVLDSPDLSGIHFTGSTAVFNSMWRTVGENVGKYRSYPRVVGETGGKDFIIAHPSADPQEVAVAIARGSFEYPGPEVLGGQPRLHPHVAVVRGARSTCRHDAADEGGRRRRLPDVPRRGDRPQGPRPHLGYLDDAKKNATVIQGGKADGDDAAISSSRHWSRRRTPRIGCSAKRSSARW